MLTEISRGLRTRGVFIAVLLATLQGASAAEPSLEIRIDASHASAPVTRYEYGMFIEPIGTLMARSLWAEMLDDRKFYFPIVAEGMDAELPKSAEGRPGGATGTAARTLGAGARVNSAGGLPIRTAMACSSWLRRTPTLMAWARVDSSWAWAEATSVLATTPAS